MAVEGIVSPDLSVIPQAGNRLILKVSGSPSSVATSAAISTAQSIAISAAEGGAGEQGPEGPPGPEGPQGPPGDSVGIIDGGYSDSTYGPGGIIDSGDSS